MPTPAHRWARRNPIITGFLALFIWATLLAYTGEIQSCRRTQGTRLVQAHNVPLNQTALREEGDRALDYSLIDRNKQGAKINWEFALRRYQLAASFKQPDVPDCFPLPGV